MQTDNKTTLVQANASITDGNNEGFLAFCTDDIVWDFVGDKKLNGKEAIRKYMLETYVEPPVFNVEELIAENEYVIAVGRITLKNPDGSSTAYRYCDIWKFREGKMAELKAFVI